MTPILTGVIASGISGHLTPPWSPEGAYDALAAVTLSTATASVTFSGIPSGYKHLQVRCLQANTTGLSNLRMSFNNDTSSTYRYHGLYGDGSSAGAFDGGTGQAYLYLGNGTTTYFASHITDILDYSSVNKNKTTKTLHGFDTNGGGVVDLLSGLYVNTSAITSITLATGTNNFSINSQFALYGVK